MSPRLLHYRTRMTVSPLFQMMKLRPCAYKAPKDTRPVLPRGRGTDCGPGRPLPVIGASPSVPSHLEETRSNTPELWDSHQRPNRILSGLRPNTGLDTLGSGKRQRGSGGHGVGERRGSERGKLGHRPPSRVPTGTVLGKRQGQAWCCGGRLPSILSPATEAPGD